ncbi:MAG: serine hydrolase [Pseudomonadota bacterium]
MSRTKRYLLSASLSLLALMLLASILVGPRFVSMVGVMASVSCSQVFGGHQPWETFITRDLNALRELEPLLTVEQSPQQQSVTGYLLGIPAVKAVYHEGYGCVSEGSPADQMEKYSSLASSGGMPLEDATGQFPRLNQFIEEEFARNGDQADNSINHRSFVALYQGRLIAEHYASPFDAKTRFASQSMAKSVNALLWAAADMRGLIDLDGPVAAPEWQPGDPRQSITNRHLLDMVSGFEFDENYEFDPFGQFFDMVLSGDLAHFAAGLELRHTPGEYWYYSTADANLSGRTLGLKLAEHGYTVHRFSDEALLGRIAADPVELQVDDAGSFWAGSAVHMTSLDWARLGQLILDGGVYRGERLLPADFLTEMGEPLPQSNGWYKSSMWLNYSLRYGEDRQLAPGLPEETISFSGFQGQKVQVIPSSELVLVRFGRTEGPGSGAVYKQFIADSYALALEEAESSRSASTPSAVRPESKAAVLNHGRALSSADTAL